MSFNIMDEAFIPTLRRDMTRKNSSMREVFVEADDIVSLDMEPVHDLGVQDMLLGILVRALRKSGLLPTGTGDPLHDEITAEEFALGTLTAMTAADREGLIETYLPPYLDRFDVMDRRNFGQSPDFAAPAKTPDADKIKGLFYTYSVSKATSPRIDAGSVALALMGLRYTATSGNHSVPVGAVKSIPKDEAGVLLLGPVSYVVGSSLWETLMFRLTPDLMFASASDTPWWENDSPGLATDESGASFRGSLSVLVNPMRRVWVGFDDDDGSVINAVVTPGDQITIDARRTHEQLLAFDTRTTAEGKLVITAAPPPSELVEGRYGDLRHYGWEGISTTLATGSGSQGGNRTMRWARHLLESGIRESGCGGVVTVRSVSAAFDKVFGGKITSISSEDLGVSTVLLMSSDPARMVSERGKEVAEAVQRTISVSIALKRFVNQVGGASTRQSVASDPAGVRVQREFIDNLDSSFRKWVTDYPLPHDGDLAQLDVSAVEHRDRWNTHIRNAALRGADDFLEGIPPSRWSFEVAGGGKSSRRDAGEMYGWLRHRIDKIITGNEDT